MCAEPSRHGTPDATARQRQTVIMPFRYCITATAKCQGHRYKRLGWPAALASRITTAYFIAEKYINIRRFITD